MPIDWSAGAGFRICWEERVRLGYVIILVFAAILSFESLESADCVPAEAIGGFTSRTPPPRHTVSLGIFPSTNAITGTRRCPQ